MPGRAARTKPAQQQAVVIKADAPLTPEERERAATGQSIEDSPELIFGLFPATGERKFEWPEYWESGKPVHIQMPPQMEWHWLTETGQTFAITIRDATLKGLCVTYGLGPDGWQWHWGGQPDNRPLLYLPALLQHPQDTIVLVEGEKTADAARRLLPEGFQATTWMGGANAIGKTDWAKLTGRNVVIWPDNDAAGTNAAFRIARQLNNIGAHASVVDLNSVSAKLPEKWDLADPFPAGITPADVLDVIRRTLNRTEDTATSIGGGAPKTLSPIKHLPPEEDPTNPDGAATEEEKAARRKEAAKHGIDREITIRPLGYLGGKFYFQSAAMQDVRGFTPRDMDNLATWMGLYPDMTYWRSQLDGAELSPRSLSERFMKECAFGGTNTKERRPFFSPSILRGRGCWIDNDRTVFHAGDELTVDGIACEPIALNSRYVYARGERFMDLGRAEPLSAKTGTELRALSHMMPWKDDNPLLADLFVGLIASAPICGAMDFRSHAWISGPSGSGKSWVMDHFAGKCLGSIALYPLGNSTEAGIRAFIKSDARPVFFDEAEGSKDISNIQRRDAIISLMRSSSTNQRGKIYKGTSDQGGMSFEIRSMFFMSSIGVGLKEWADENRCLVLDLRGPGADTAADRTKRKETFAKLQAGLRKFPPALDASLMARMVTRVTQVLHTTKLFSTILQHHLGSTGIKRVGDLIGTPLAALWWLCHDEAPSDDIAAEAFLSGYDFSPWTRTPETREDISLFRHLTSQVMLATLRGGERGERSIGDMMLVISGSSEADQKIDKEEAATALMNRGIRYDWHEARAGFWIAKHHHRMDDLMKGSWFQDGWFGVLASHPEAKTAEANKTIRFGAGVKTTAIFIPIEVLLPE